ncbi:MAG: AraC family transcriptional regulator [Planctomycetes bacterium]|nr:AraC family transcriptional regulator [Planctomycetota bacterium]
MLPQVQKVPHPGESSFLYRVKADPRFRRGWHCHPEHELTYIVESRGRRFVGDTIAEYRSGDMVLLGPDVPHTWISADAGSRTGTGTSTGTGGRLHRAIVIQFQGAFLGDALGRSPELRPVARLLERSARGLQVTGRTRDEAARRMLAMRRLGALDRLLELLRVLDLLARGGADLRPISKSVLLPPPDPRARRRFDRVFAYLTEHHAGRASQAEAARLAGMTPAGFSRFFRRTAGRTFVEHLAELRVGRACDLLATTDIPILEVSLRSGFQNLSNFNRRFRDLRGMTPREYRARHAEAAG